VVLRLHLRLLLVVLELQLMQPHAAATATDATSLLLLRQRRRRVGVAAMVQRRRAAATCWRRARKHWAAGRCWPRATCATVAPGPARDQAVELLQAVAQLDVFAVEVGVFGDRLLPLVRELLDLRQHVCLLQRERLHLRQQHVVVRRQLLGLCGACRARGSVCESAQEEGARGVSRL
jgi:hypothetical protein